MVLPAKTLSRRRTQRNAPLCLRNTSNECLRINGRKLHFPIADQQRANQDKASRPREREETISTALRKTNFQPSRTAGNHSKNREWKMAQFGEVLLSNV